MKPKISLKVISVIIFFIYLLSVCATLPFAFMVNNFNNGSRLIHYVIDYDVYSKSSCGMVEFWTAMFFATTLLPTAIMTAVYYSSSVALRKSSAAMQSSMQWKKRIVRNRKVNRMFIVAVVCFFVTVAPYTTASVIVSFLKKYDFSLVVENNMVVTWLELVLRTIMTFNCFIHPVVYCKMHKDVVVFIKKMLLARKRNCAR